MVQGKKRDPVTVKQDTDDAEHIRIARLVTKNITGHIKAETDKMLKSTLEVVQENLHVAATTSGGRMKYLHMLERNLPMEIQDLEDRVEYLEERNQHLNSQLMKLKDEMRMIRKEKEHYKLFYDAKMKYDTGEDAPPGYFDED